MKRRISTSDIWADFCAALTSYDGGMTVEQLLNDGWQFCKLPLGSTLEDVSNAALQAVDLPHDFLIENENDLYETTDAWYLRTLDVPESWCASCVLVRFDGVYMDCDVLLNGHVVCTHHYGYTAFDVDLTSRLLVGRNTLAVHIRHQSPNSRWYSGLGIYRDVTLHVLPKRHIPLDGVYVTTTHELESWTMTIDTELCGVKDNSVLTHVLLDGDVPVCDVTVEAAGDHANAVMQVLSPKLWSPDAPNVYTLQTMLGNQVIRQNVGFRDLTFTTDRGLLVNGAPVKLHGVCLHHDLGCLGSAFHEKAMRRQLRAMRQMGVNALRTSHNPPAKQVMDLCDELGIFVVDEAFDMWLRAKTSFDYARFFPTDMPSDVAAWVRRDRNHPSLLMWSIGNEILDTHLDESAQQVTCDLCENVRLHDPRGNAIITIGSNFMPWEGARKCADLVDAQGYNYGEKYYEAHHAEHPDWVIYGSETASALSSRGIYHFPMAASILSDEDLQCSALGNSTSSWGTKDMRKCIVEDLNTPYSLGQFLWSGIDYIGEPTPYHTRSCYFGMMDTAVFPKDYWYLFKSLWTNAPMVHIGVYWDWNPGQMIDVPVMTNGVKAELLLNGRSLGVQEVSRTDWTHCRPAWQVPFEAGELVARAYDADGHLIAEDIQRTPGESHHIVLSAEDAFLLGDGEDMTFVTITVADENGNPVENAVDRVLVDVDGCGRLLGLDNGDSTDRDGYKTNTRRLFSGKLLAIVGALAGEGSIHIRVSGAGLVGAELTLPVRAARKTPGRSCSAVLCRQEEMPADKPVRRIELLPLGDKRLGSEHPTVSFRVAVHPADADKQAIAFRVTNGQGIDSPCASCSVDGDVVTVTALGDDTVYLRASCTNGYDHPRIISQQDIVITGLGQPFLDPYGFISGGLYSLSSGEIGNGNEQGISFARDGESMAGYTKIDFGDVGSDVITLPVFALDSNLYEIKLWDGDPADGGRLIAVLPYQKPSIWNVYQSETYHLPERLTGVHTLCFSLTSKIHLKGFSFEKQSRAWLPQTAQDADTVYGDSFTRSGSAVTSIGNNVSLVWENMDFGASTHAELRLDGQTPLSTNPVTIRFTNQEGEQLTSLAQFSGTERGVQCFDVNVLPGVCSVAFVFLPGSQFDFYGFTFVKQEEAAQ